MNLAAFYVPFTTERIIMVIGRKLKQQMINKDFLFVEFEVFICNLSSDGSWEMSLYDILYIVHIQVMSVTVYF